MSAATLEFKVALAVVLVGAVAYMAYKGVKVGAKVVDAVNPFNPDNVINKAANDAYRAATGSKGNIGFAIYDLTHPDMTETNDAIRKEIEESGYQWQL